LPRSHTPLSPDISILTLSPPPPPSLSLSNRTADLSDIIAGQHEDVAKQVLEILCNSIQDYPLAELNLSDNALGLKGVVACSNALRKQSALKRLYFNNNGLQYEGVELIAKLVLESESAKTLNSFSIHNNLLQDAGAKALAPLVRALPQLENLRVTTTRISTEGGQALVQALLDCGSHSLVSLNLSDNTLGEVSGEILVQVLQDQPNLVELNLGDTSIEEKALLGVIDALRNTAPNLKAFEFSACEVSADIAPHMASMFLTKPHLERVLLDTNQIGSIGAYKICRALAKHKNLVNLDLEGNEIQTSAAVRIAKLIAAGSYPRLERLNLDNNMFKESGTTALTEAIKIANLNADVLVELELNDDDYDVSDEEFDGAAETIEEADGAAQAAASTAADADVDALASSMAGATI
jgi:Ran GTPase-activating protein 1